MIHLDYINAERHFDFFFTTRPPILVPTASTNGSKVSQEDNAESSTASTEQSLSVDLEKQEDASDENSPQVITDAVQTHQKILEDASNLIHRKSLKSPEEATRG